MRDLIHVQTAVKNLQSSQCCEGFKKQSHLKRHIEIHSSNKQFLYNVRLSEENISSIVGMPTNT
jgi:hypothetical protein